MNKENYKSNLKKILGARNMQEKLENTVSGKNLELPTILELSKLLDFIFGHAS